MSSLWWHLAMTYHMEPYPGHATGKTRDCFECQTIVGLVEKAASK